MSSYAMPVDVERKLYLDGIELFNDHEFFEAHEALEIVWLRAKGDRKTFLHGLIQVAAAFHHYTHRNPADLGLYPRGNTESRRRPPLFAHQDRVYLKECRGGLSAGPS